MVSTGHHASGRAALVLLGACLALSAGTAAAAGWQLSTAIHPTVAFGVGFFNASHGFVSGMQNGMGPTVWNTVDSGATFVASPVADAVMLASAAADIGGSEAVLSGFVSGHYSANGGATWALSKSGVGIGPCQSAEAVQGARGSFALTAQTDLYNGVTVSTDGGVTFQPKTSAWATNNNATAFCPARFGAFPSSTTFYATCGIWPKSNAAAAASSVLELNERMAVEPRTGRLLPNPRALGLSADDDDSNPGQYVLGVSKTTDGGKTWKQLAFNTGGQYANQIDCGDEDHCVYVAEAVTPVPSASIFTTADGGATWSEFKMTQSYCSLTSVRFVSATEVWVGGAYGVKSKSGLAEIGVMYHSTDAGKTWTSSEIPNLYISHMTFTSPTTGFATAYSYGAAGPQGAFATYSA